MIPGLALLWAAGLGDAAPNLPRLRLSFQGRCTWQIEGRLEVNRKRASVERLAGTSICMPITGHLLGWGHS